MSEILIERLGHKGDGIAAGPIYAARTLPGETVSGEVVDGRIVAPRIVTPSDQRVSPPCPHYKACGGCSLMHASDGFVADWKIGVVRAALTAQCIEAPITGIATSPPRSRRRAVFSARRTRKGALVGFHGRASDTLTAVTACQVLSPAIVAALPTLEALALAGGSRKGEMSIAVTEARGGLDVSVTGGKPAEIALQSELAQIAGQGGIIRLTWENEAIITATPPRLAIGRAEISPPPGTFLQATAEGQDSLIAAVRRAVGDAGHVVDLFAGCGTFALPLAEEAEVLAVEGEAPMLEALSEGWRHALGLKAVRTARRDLFRRPLLPDELKSFDAAVIDPPRAGAEAQTIEIARSALPILAAVSCNPVTFARDARILVDAGFKLDWIEVIDQFRWSPHVELAARFSRLT